MLASIVDDGLRSQELVTHHQQEKLQRKVSVLTYKASEQRSIVILKERPCFVIKEVRLIGCHELL